MRTVDLIQRKRDGKELAPEEIEFLVEGYTNGDIPDYQMSSFLMAVFFSGMSDREVSRLTECMLRSGDTVDLSAIPGVKAFCVFLWSRCRPTGGRSGLQLQRLGFPFKERFET